LSQTGVSIHCHSVDGFPEAALLAGGIDSKKTQEGKQDSDSLAVSL
jgi:hypothetical protein